MSVATYTAIIAAIDTAIANWVGEPVVIEQGGKRLEARSLKELIDTRREYARLLATARSGKPWAMTRLRNGGAA